jgi:hypothetical protein
MGAPVVPGVIALVLYLMSLVPAAGSAPPAPLAVGGGARIPAPADALRADLAQRLGVEADAITLVQFEQVTWSDGCLGVYLPGAICAQSLQPGFLALLTGGARFYRYHGSGGAFIATDFVPGATVSDPVAGLEPARSAIRVIDLASDAQGRPGRGLIP